MDLMSKVENIELLGGMIKHFATHRGTLDNVFDLEDGWIFDLEDGWIIA